VPYKHYETEIINQAITDEQDVKDAGVEDSTIRRWKEWYKNIRIRFDQCVASLKEQYKLEPGEDMSVLTSTAHQPYGHRHSNNSPTLAQIVQIIINGNFGFRPS
jgi:hypothetical protein